MMSEAQAFSASYAQARGKFLAAAAANQLPVRSYVHPLSGRDGEALAMDVVLDGALDARRLLIVTSACHGVEGFCGSGVQVFALRAEHWLNNHPEAPVALAKEIKQQMLTAFYTDTDAWKEQIISQARQALRPAASGLST